MTSPSDTTIEATKALERPLIEWLRPCRWCGGISHCIAFIDGGQQQQIECNNCESRGPARHTKAEAVAAWNLRAPNPALEAAGRREAGLRAALRKYGQHMLMCAMSEPRTYVCTCGLSEALAAGPEVDRG